MAVSGKQRNAAIPSDTDTNRSGISKIDSVIERMARAVVGGEYSGGTLLPPESELGKRYKVSRSVIREAIRRLSGAGLVETRHGMGTYIKPSSQWQVLDPLLLQAFIDSGNLPAISTELVQLRSTIEVEAARIAAQQITAKQLQVLQQWLEQMDLSLEDDLETFARADIAYHDVIIASTENRFFTQIMKSLASPISTARHITTKIGGREGRTEAQKWHREIFQAISARNPQAAGEAMRYHMEQLEHIIKRALLIMASTNDKGREIITDK